MTLPEAYTAELSWNGCCLPPLPPPPLPSLIVWLKRREKAAMPGMVIFNIGYWELSVFNNTDYYWHGTIDAPGHWLINIMLSLGGLAHYHYFSGWPLQPGLYLPACLSY